MAFSWAIRFGQSAAIVLLASLASAQDQPNNVHQATTTPANARFEILQSELAARITFRLDRFTGHVSQFVRTSDDDNTWEEMDIIDLPEVEKSTRPRFQIFTSGIAVRFTLLVDNDTGRTWQVVTSKQKLTSGKEIDVTQWIPIRE